MNNGRLQHIDVWRSFAIALVLVCHIVAFSHPWYREVMPGLVWRLQPNGTVGVQIFFCISGFVICRGLMREFQASGAISMSAFYIRRAYRILPPLAVFIAAVAALNAFGIFDLNFSQFAQAALFLCSMESVGDCGWALGHTWSLAYEEQFYLFFPVLVGGFSLVSKPHRLLWALGCLVSIFVLVTIFGGWPHFATYINHFVYMIAGCVCALYWNSLQPMFRRLPLAVWVMAILSLVGLNAVGLPASVRTLVYPVVFPVLVCIAVFGTPINRPVVQSIFLNPALAHLGRISYGIYLWQQLATHNYGFRSPIVALVLVVCSIIVAHYSYRYFELPLIKLGAVKSVTEPRVTDPVGSRQENLDEDFESRLV